MYQNVFQIQYTNTKYIFKMYCKFKIRIFTLNTYVTYLYLRYYRSLCTCMTLSRVQVSQLDGVYSVYMYDTVTCTGVTAGWCIQCTRATLLDSVQ